MKTFRAVSTRQVSRTKRSILCLACAVLSLITVAAGEEKAATRPESIPKTSGNPEDKKKLPTAAKPAEEIKRITTGSYIPQKVKRNGPIAHSTSPVYVVDRQAIEQTGATTVSQVLKRRVTSIR